MVEGRWGKHVVSGRTKRDVMKKLEALIDDECVESFVRRNLAGSVEIDGVEHRIYIKSEVLPPYRG
jgi:hypothetical protein